MQAINFIHRILAGYEALSQDLSTKPTRKPFLPVGLIAFLVSCLAGLYALHHLHHPLGTFEFSSASHFSLQTNGTRRICIVMHNSNDTDMFHSPDHGSNPNHAEYADIHGYPFRLATQPYVNWVDRGPQSGWIKSSGEHGYNKIIHLADSILHGMKTGEYDWVLWADGDTWIVNPSIELESYLPPSHADYERSKQPHFLATVDENGFNDGTFFLRVNYWSLSFLYQALADIYQPFTRYDGYSDQRSIYRLLRDDADAAAHFYAMPQDWFNFYPGNMSNLEQEYQIRDTTLQIHLVDKLKNDEGAFKRNMAHVRQGWDRVLERTTIQLPERHSRRQLLQASIYTLADNSHVRDLAYSFWKADAKSGMDGIVGLDMQR